MSKLRKKYVGKVGFCYDETLGFKNKNAKSEGHYVYIRKINETRKPTCDVQVCGIYRPQSVF